MGQKVIIQLIEIRTLVDKGVGFDFGNLPGSDPLAQQPIIEGIRTWKIDQQQPSWLEYASDLPERPYDPIPSVMVDRRYRQRGIECSVRPGQRMHIGNLPVKTDPTVRARLTG